MHNSNTIHMQTLTGPDVPRKAFEAFRALPGRCVVEMAEPSESMGSIYLPDKVSRKYRPHVGRVLSYGPPVSRKTGQAYCEGALSPGDTVLCRPYDGAWFWGFKSGSYETDREVRFYGMEGSDYDGSRLIDLFESIVAKVVGGMIIPTPGNVVIRIDDEPSKSIALPDSAKPKGLGTVVATSGYDALVAGQRISYTPDDELDLSISFDDRSKGLAIIREHSVLAQF